jgi:putative exosortase-associated protein (TIGR04073 family)
MKPRDEKHMRIGSCVVAIGTLLALTLGAASGASAKEYTAARKAGRGLAAMTTGFLELPGNMVAETRRSGPAMGFTLGFVKGLGGIVVRELVGVYEFVSAPIEAPRGYRPVITPEFPWGYFDETRELAETRRSSSVASAEPRAPDASGVSNFWGAPTAAASGR